MRTNHKRMHTSTRVEADNLSGPAVRVHVTTAVAGGGSDCPYTVPFANAADRELMATVGKAVISCICGCGRVMRNMRIPGERKPTKPANVHSLHRGLRIMERRAVC